MRGTIDSMVDLADRDRWTENWGEVCGVKRRLDVLLLAMELEELFNAPSIGVRGLQHAGEGARRAWDSRCQ